MEGRGLVAGERGRHWRRQFCELIGIKSPIWKLHVAVGFWVSVVPIARGEVGGVERG